MCAPSILLLLHATLPGQLTIEAMEAAKAQERRDYYARWVGVAAPELGSNVHDRLRGPAVRLKQFRGKKTLLFSFDSGNFVYGADDNAFPENLRTLDRAIRDLEGVEVSVVGFTLGVMFFFPNVDISDEIRRLSNFPVVNCRAAASPDSPGPYHLLKRPGGIVIDRNGIIQAIFTEAMTERQIRFALAAPDWDEPIRPAPVDDPWRGRRPPMPLGTVVRDWSKRTEGLVGLTRGDWDGDGHDDIILLQADHKLSVLEPTGREKIVIPMRAVSKMPFAIRLRRKPNGSELLQCRGGWPREIPVFDTEGRRAWSYPETEIGGINAATWVDIDGDGSAEMLVGFSGNAGLRLVSSDGESLWTNTDVKNRWCVAGFDARDGRPGLALSTGADGAIRIYDADGRRVGRVVSDGQPIVTFAAAEMSNAGDRQVLFVQEASVGQVDQAVAADLGGNVLWRYPIVSFRVTRFPAPMLAADVTGDGVKEWVFQVSTSQVVAVDTNGRLIAQLPTPSVGPVLLTSTKPAARKAELILVSDGTSLVAYKVNALTSP